MAQAINLSQAKTGQSYQVCANVSTKSTNQKLTLMGLGVGMMIELVALYKHGAVLITPFGDIAIGSELIESISVSLI
ncbi:MAG: ferrous iron transport protein A [Proteobacteria bacterium]|nr:ferrous iron transport protein A [Pseudomonadota bacterium]